MSRSIAGRSANTRRGTRAALRQLTAAAAVAITLFEAVGPLTPIASAIEPPSQAEALPTVSPNGRVVQVAPAPITTPAGGGSPETDPTIGGAPLFLPYTPPADTAELPEQRTRQSRTLANPDGTFTTEISDGPINFKDAEGNWQPIDLSLEGDAINGYKVAATAGEITLGDASGALGKIEINGHTVSLAPTEYAIGIKGSGDDANKVDFAAPAETAPALWIRPVDIGLEFGATFVDATITPSVTLRLDAGDLFPAIGKDGKTIVFTDSVGEFAGRIDRPILREGSEDGPPILDPVSVSLDFDSIAGYTLTYSIDPKWFESPERTFPVILDPTFCLGEGSGSEGCTYDNQSATNFDTFVFDDDPDNYESGWTVIRTGYDVRTDDGSVYGKMRSILKFPPVALADGAVIYDTDLQTRICCLYGNAEGQVIKAYRLTKALTTQYTWTKFGNAFEPIVGAVSATVPASGYMHWDVDEIVRSWYTRRAKDYKAPHGFLLKMDNEGSAYGEVEFRRYNYGTAAYRPLLTISYTIPAVGIDFDPRLGSTYAPSTMVAGQAVTLPLTITNNAASAHTLSQCDDDPVFDTDCWLVGYRWFDGKGNLVGGGDDASMDDLPTASIAIGATTAVFPFEVMPPSTVGQYTLRLDLVHRYTNTRSWASDAATPSLYYSRNKKILTTSSTRWTGSSKIERDEFSINVTAGVGGSNVESVPVSSGGAIGIDLNSRNLTLAGDTGLGFADRISLGLTYSYNEALAELCAGYAGILGSCGWSTNWDERITGGANRTGFDYWYLDPHGVPSMLDTDENGQIAGGAPVLANRQRVTILDETAGWDGSDANGTPDILAVDAGTEGISGGAFSGQNVAKVASNANFSVNAPDLVSLNIYKKARFAIRTTSATKAGMCFKIHNLTDSSITDRWWCYTLGSADWTTTYDQEYVSGTILNTWKYVDQDLYDDVRQDGDFGTTKDDYQVVAIQIQSSSGSNAGSTYVDGFRFESDSTVILAEAEASWTTDTSNPTVLSSDAMVGSNSIEVHPGTGVQPTCKTSNSCWGSTMGGMWAYPFVDWYWKKSGGVSAAMVFYLHNERTGGRCNTADCTLTYYAGASPTFTGPAEGWVNIRIADRVPESWTLVRRDLLDDARQALNLFDDGGTGGGDDIRIVGWAPVAVDGSKLLIDQFEYGNLADVGETDPTGAAATVGHPSSVGDSTYVYDFTADYADGSRHYFNRDGLLVRIRDRDQQQVTLDWTIDPTTAGQAAYTLTAIHAPGDATTSGGTTFERQFTLSRGADGSLDTLRFDEDLGSTGYDSSDRETIFEVSDPASTSFSGGPTTATYGVNGNHEWLGAVFYPKPGTSVTITGSISGNSNRSVGINCPEGGKADTYINPATSSPFAVTAPPNSWDGCRAYVWAGATTVTLSGWQVSYTQAAGDLAKVSQARHAVGSGASGTFCGTRPNGCVEYTYVDTTNHRLATVDDPRWDGSTSGSADYRLEIGRNSNDPVSIKDRSHSSSTLLNVLDFDDDRDPSLKYTRALWQDAAAAAAGAAIATDLNPDGSALTRYVPRACTSNDCSTSGNWPAYATQSDYKAVDYEYDGLSRVTTVKTYRCPVAAVGGCSGGQLVTMTRSETNSGAKIDNYADPLAGGRLAWRATADQVFASLKDSKGANSDWYRTEYVYDGSGQVSKTIEVRQLDAAYYFEAAMNNSPTAYWRLGEASGNFTDSSGNGKTGTATSITYAQDGAIVRDANKAANFNGTSSKVTASVTLGTGAYSIAGWIKADTAGQFSRGLFGRYLSSTGAKVYLKAGGNFGLQHNASLITTSIVPEAGRWYYLVATFDGTMARLYVDGELAADLYDTSSTGAGGSAFEIGTASNGTGGFFDGSIDEVTVYSAALAPWRIAAFFRAGRAVTAVDTTVLRDKAGRPVETATLFNVNPGFEQHTYGWALGSGASIDTANPANSGSGSLLTSTSVSTEIGQLVPGQTVRFQFATKASSGTNVHAKFEYWRTSGTPAWQQFGVDTDFGNTSWGGHAYDITLPMDTDGRVKISFSKSGAGSGWVDDALLVTSWAKVDYDTTTPGAIGYGLPTDTTTLATCLVGPCANGTVKAHVAYAANTTSPTYHPAIFPTTTIANYQNGVQGPDAFDDVTSEVAYDAWGRKLVTTDPDDVTATTVFATNKTDVASTADGLGNTTTMTYDAVGNTLTITTPLGRVTSATYDARNHTLTTTAPDGVVSRTDYDNYGRVTASWSNYVNGVVESGDGDLTDDLLAVPTYDAFGRVVQQDAECGSVATCATGGLDARTATTYDLLGNAVSTTVYAGSGGTSGRTTTNRFETYDPTAGPYATTGVFSRTAATGVIAAIAPSGSPAPLCPEAGTSTRCNTVSTLDLSGRAILTTDAYGIVTRTRYDIAGKPIEVTANYVAGQSETVDRNLVSTTVYDLAGNPVQSWDPSDRSEVRNYDVLGRLLQVEYLDSTGSEYASESTEYLPSGRVDRSFDGSAWTKTVYDGAGRAIRTVANYDSSGAGMTLDALEGTAAAWSIASSGFFTSSAATAKTDDTDAAGNAYATVAPQSGRGRLHVTTHATNTNDGVWLDVTDPVAAPYQSGHTYNASFDLATDAAGVSLTAYLGQDQSGGTYGSLGITSTTTWTRYTVSWTAGSSVTSNVRFAVRKPAAGTSRIYIDNLVVWDTNAGWSDKNIASSVSSYNADGEIISSVLPPGDPATERPLVTTVAFDPAGRTVASVTNGVSGGYVATILGTANLAAYVALDERLGTTYADRKTGASTLSVSGTAPTNGVAGGIDEARTGLRTTGGYLTRASNATSNTTNVSMEAWIRTDAGNPASTAVVAANGTQANGWGIGIDSSGNAAGVAISSSTLTTMASSQKVNDGAWHHLVLTRGASTWAMTIDGVAKTLSNNTTNPGTPGAGLSISALSDGTRAFTGEIDEVSAYTADISGSTATAHWNAGRRSDAVTALTTRNAYDRLGRLVDAWAPDLVRTKAGYDRLGNQVETIANYRDGTTTGGTADDDVRSTYAYDVLGELIGYCPAEEVKVGGCNPADINEDQAWHYVFDAMGRQSKTIPPDNTTIVDLTTEEVVYEAGGRVGKTCRYPAGSACGQYTSRHVDFTYDNLGRTLTQKTWDRGANPAADLLKFTKTMTWNKDGSPDTVNEGSDTLTYTYDNAGRLYQLKRSATVLTTYTYTSGTGTIATRADGTQGTITFSYDWARRQTVIDPPDTYVAGTVTRSYRLDGLLATQSFPSSLTETLAYDEVKRPTSISLGIAGSISQSFDRGGRITSDARSLTGISGDAGTGTQSFTYDGLSRLTGSSGLAGSRSYQYDLDGNRTRRVEGAVTTDFTYDRADQLATQTVTGLATKSFDYDRDGNLLSGWDGTNAQTTYAYDEANRLTTIAPPGGAGNQVTFTMDALDRHATRSVGGSAADTYGYLDATETAYQVGNATTTGSLLDAEGSRLAVKTGSTVSWLLFDLHGSVAAICPAASTTLSDAYRYDGFGQQIASAGSVTNPWRYRGLLNLTQDFGAGALLDMNARDYSPQLGVFTQEDTVAGSAANPFTMNRFLYALANPATLIDPDGHMAQSAAAMQTGGLIDYRVITAAEEAKRIESVNGDPATQLDPVVPALQHLFEGTAWLLTAGFLHQSDPNLRDAAATGAGIGLDAADRGIDAEIEAVITRAKAAQAAYEAQVGRLRNADVPSGFMKSLKFRADRLLDMKLLGIANDVRRLKVFGETAYLRGLKGVVFVAGLGVSFINGYLEQEDRDLARGLPPEYVTARKVVRGTFEMVGDFAGFLGGAAACSVGTGWVGTAVALGCGAVGAQWVSQGANGLADWGFDRIDELLGYK